ncbi:MAG: hypothetical protein ABIG68_02660 [Acidobacteriota bacterium]
MQNKIPTTDHTPFDTLDRVRKKPRKPKQHDPEIQRWFDAEFWPVYPRHTAKEAARTAADKLATDPSILPAVIEGLRKQVPAMKADPQYIPHPATWLNGKRWEDEIHNEPEPYKPNYYTPPTLAGGGDV